MKYDPVSNAPVDVLDHGYVKFIEHWGSDERIIEAARMSTGGGFKGWGTIHGCKDCGQQGAYREGHSKEDEPWRCIKCKSTNLGPGKKGDEKLLRYLYENKHATPFEMAGMVIEVKAPIFIFRQWHRHRTQSYNEMSARYVELPAEDYIPSVERLLGKVDGSNKQAGRRLGTHGDDLDASITQSRILGAQAKAEEAYQDLLTAGVPRELARLVLPVSRYSVMRASANLRNWLAFMTLRCDPHAQEEIRQYAHVVSSMIESCFPRTHALWVEGVEKAEADKLCRKFVQELYASVFETWKSER